jgi:galactose-1-phosphate uridylyltransferase
MRSPTSVAATTSTWFSPRARLPGMAGNENSCIFCKLAAGEIPATLLHEDAHLVAFQDIHPQAPTHLLVVPRKHIPSLNALAPGDVW